MPLNNMSRMLTIAGYAFEQSELDEPIRTMEGEVGNSGHGRSPRRHEGNAARVEVDLASDEVEIDGYDATALLGSVLNADAPCRVATGFCLRSVLIWQRHELGRQEVETADPVSAFRNPGDMDASVARIIDDVDEGGIAAVLEQPTRSAR